MGPDGEIDSASLERHLSHLLQAGIHGLWVNGTTGEFYALDVELRARVVRECVKVVAGSVPVVAHVGDTSTRLALDHARAAAEAGADFLSVLPPFFVDFTQPELKDHYRAIAQVANVPLFAYNLPQMTPVGLTVASIVELASEGVIVGAKDSSSDMVWFRQLLRASSESETPLSCFTGGSGVSDLGLFQGAAGAMSSTANLTPRHLVALFSAAEVEDWAQVRTLQGQTDALVAALRLPQRPATSSLTAGVIKFLLARLGRIDSAHAAAPLSGLTDEEQAHLLQHAAPLIDDLEREQPQDHE